MVDNTVSSEQNIDIGSGLVMRRSRPEDADRLAEFNGRIHGDDPHDAAGVAAWTHDLLTRPHPTFGSDDFLIVEELATGKLISTMNLISQTWSYDGIPFKVGRPELVGTDPEYRSRGLVRRQFEVVHRWSAERGEMVQVITGIPNFYRQYGYEMALHLGGGRSGFEPQLPKLKEGEKEPYRVRPAVENDIPFLRSMYERECSYSMINAVWDEALWRYEITGKNKDNISRWTPHVIETSDGRPAGYLMHSSTVWGKGMTASRYVLAEGFSYLAVTPSIFRYLWSVGLKYAEALDRKLEVFTLGLGAAHPAYDAMHDRLVRTRHPYAFYIRVPDLPAFIRQIAPALERRLVGSACEGHTGELKISMYRSGLRLVFENGRLVVSEPWKPKIKDDEGNAGFPGLTFLQLVFGFNTLSDVRVVYPDCWASPDASVVLKALFPKKASNVWVIS